MSRRKNESNPLHRPMYFDFAAATPVHPKVAEVMQSFFTDDFYNPSAQYEQSRMVRQKLDDARASAAQSLGTRPSEIVFTAGGSESISLAINGVMQQPENHDRAVVISAIEHDAVRKTAQRYAAETLGVDEKGVVIIDELRSILEQNKDIALVSVMMVNNEIGTVQPIAELGEVIKQHNKQRRRDGRQDVLLHVDACQAALYLDVQPARLGVDLMTINGGKIYGPKQSGILYVRTGVELLPVISGGGQEFGLRSGTENVAFDIAIAKALELACRGKSDRAKHTASIRDFLIDELESIGGTIYGHRTKRVASNVLVGFEGVDNERLLIALDLKGFAVASGSACHASSGEPSHVLRAMGVSDEDAQSTLRLSINEYTTKEDCSHLVAEIKKIIK